MLAVVEIAGKQFPVRENMELEVPKLKNEVGSTVSFDKVLLVDNDGKVSIGSPHVKNASVKASVLDHGKGDKIIIFKKKRRQDYRKKNGHRQQFTSIKIESISAK